MASVSLQTANARQGAIATPHALATETGRRVLHEGGSAIDAAIAASAVLTVVYPHNTSIGGDSVTLVSTPDGSVTCVNATGSAPAAVSASALRERHGGTLPVVGIDTVTVPGAVRGWDAMRQLGARLDWQEQLADAIAFAEDGVPVAPSLAGAIVAADAALRADPGCFATFFDEQGRGLGLGDELRNPALAASLRAVARGGSDEFYAGDVGQRLVTGLRSLGSVMAVDDLSGYRPSIEAPIAGRFGGRTVLTSGPNTQGFLLLRFLAFLERHDLVASALAGSAGELAREFDHGNALRETLLADPTFAEFDTEALIAGADGQPGESWAAGGLIPRGDTVGIAVVDSEGMAVSHIQSVFHHFGASVLEPSTGILLQNRGTAFSLTDGSPNMIEPLKRPGHTLMPVMVQERGRLVAVNACMGGKAQAQIHTQLILQQAADASAERTVGAPRFIVGPTAPTAPPNSIYVEENFDALGRDALRSTGMPFTQMPPHTEMLGQANVIHIAADGTCDPASDPRSDGAATVVQR